MFDRRVAARGGALALAALSGPLSLPSVARAQAGDATALPEIAVEAPAAAAGQGSLTVPSVAAERARVLSTIGSVGFIDAANLENRYTNNLVDVLKDQPGVVVGTRYGQELRLSVRGSGVARSFHTRGIEILQDGIPFNLADGSGDYYQVDPLALRAVEIYKGGNALIFGSSTLGGAINFVTPTAYTAVAPTFVRFEGGSFGAVRSSFQASRVEGDADALVNITRSHQDGFRTHQNQDYTQFNA
ncbi:MAG: TonB-dependent receptor plug domain-containing protein, partial [Methylobacteriaceae bacterium]|nr:TonB-dependent receptor plug domain-containing protein [Methylobacteriaceae bacterium]